MDLRDLIREDKDDIVGHESVEKLLNLKKEIKRFSIDPLSNFLNKIDPSNSNSMMVNTDITKYKKSFSWYTLSLERVLNHISIIRRAEQEFSDPHKNKQYSNKQKQLANKFNNSWKYIEIDYQSLIIYSCILLDRTISLSRHFLCGNNLPSFTSFNKHKEFLKNNKVELNKTHKEYKDYILTNTEWYEIPLKVLRDKYLMHSSEIHMSLLGFSNSNWDLEMATTIPANKNQNKSLKKVKVIRFSSRRLARDIESFLQWFAQYGIKNIK